MRNTAENRTIQKNLKLPTTNKQPSSQEHMLNEIDKLYETLDSINKISTGVSHLVMNYYNF